MQMRRESDRSDLHAYLYMTRYDGTSNKKGLDSFWHDPNVWNVRCKTDVSVPGQIVKLKKNSRDCNRIFGQFFNDLLSLCFFHRHKYKCNMYSLV